MEIFNNTTFRRAKNVWYSVLIFAVLMKNRIEPKRIRFVHPYINSKANLVLIEGIKGSGVWLDVEPPLAVYKDKNVYTDEVLKIYGR